MGLKFFIQSLNMSEEKLFYNNKEYILGATVSFKSGTGGMTYSLSGLCGYKNYNLILVSFKNEGISSNIVGPYYLNYFIDEYREPIYTFLWNHPADYRLDNLHQRTYSQRNVENLISPSQASPISNLENWEREYYDGAWGNYAANSYFTSQKGFTAPDGSTSATRFRVNGWTGYILHRLITEVNGKNEYIELKKGITYYLSFWLDMSSGRTLGEISPRTHDGPNGIWATNPPWPLSVSQISPVYRPEGLGSYPYLAPVGTTGWTRFVYGIRSTTGGTNYVNIYLLSTGNLDGSTYDWYFWGAQLEEESGPSATSYKPNIISDVNLVGSVYDRDTGNTLYDNSIENIPTWCSNNGITYFWPLIQLWDSTNYDMPTYSANDYYDFYTKRAINIFKLLPKKQRAIRPRGLDHPIMFEMYDDAITGLTFGPYPGVTYTYWGITEGYKYYTIPSATAYMGHVWPVTGISAGITAWNKFFNNFHSRGATIDYVFFDYEFVPFSTLYVQKDQTALGWTAARKIFEDPRYSQPWNGVTALKDIMDNLGATLINMEDAYYNNYNHLAWSRTIGYQTQKAYELILTPGLSAYFPEATVSNYNYFHQPDGITNGSYDQATHQIPGDLRAGNASSPVLYGDVWSFYSDIPGGGQSQARLPLSDPTRFEKFINTGGPTVSTGTLTRPWIAFMLAMLQMRCTKAAEPNVPITPWIGNVRWPGEAYGGSYGRPVNAWSDTKLGYNEKYGSTYHIEGGNSAYYYEMIRHCMLMGTKAFPMFNGSLYDDVRTPGWTSGNPSATNRRLYFLSGMTTHMEEIIPVDNVIHEVHNLIGGFTLTTADTSRPNWLAPYFASAAPGINGTTWWWRVTVGSTYTINVQGTTLSGISGPWGAWVSTTGPTLAGVNISIV